MEPIKSALGKWEVFLEAFANQVKLSIKYEKLLKHRNQLALIDRKIDKIAEVIKQSPTAQRNLEDILNNLRYSTIKTPLDSPPLLIYQELYQLHYSIICSLNLSLETKDHLYSSENNLQKKFDTHNIGTLEAIPLDPEFTKANPNLKIIDYQLKKFHTLFWKCFFLDKEQRVREFIAEAARILMFKCEKLLLSHEELVTIDSLNLMMTILTHTQVEIKALILIRFLALGYNEIIWEQLFKSVSDYQQDELKDYFPLLELMHRDREFLIGILKENFQAAFNLQQFLHRLCSIYKALKVSPKDGKAVITLFDMILYLNQRLESFSTPEMKEVCDDKVIIQFDEGPVYLRKYWVIVLAVHSPVIHRMIFGDMKESVKFASENLMTFKDVSRKDFRLLLKHYFDCKDLPINETLRLSRIGEFLDFKRIREATSESIKNFLETLPKHALGYYTDESFVTICELCKSLSEANLISALSAVIESLRLPTLIYGEPLQHSIFKESKEHEYSSRYFKQFGFRYSIIRKHFPERLGTVHKAEVVIFIRGMVSHFLADEDKFFKLLRSMRDVILLEPLETGLELKEKTEFGGFVLVDQKKTSIQFDLDLSDYPVKFKMLEALRGIYIGKLTLKKGNLSVKELEKVNKLFPGVVVVESD